MHRFHRFAGLSDAEREFALGSTRNWEIGEPAYDVHRCRETGGSIRSSAGIAFATSHRRQEFRHPDWSGGSVVAGALTPGVIKFLRQGVERPGE